jgi:hypothetical protein
MEPQVRIDFEKMAISFREYVREKAINAGSTIVYVEDGNLIEEDPATNEKKVLKTADEMANS